MVMEGMRGFMSTVLPDNVVVQDALRAVLRERGEVVVPAEGYSMGMRYRRTDGLVLRLPERRIRVGDVVAYARGAIWVLHRVMLARGDLLWTQGDALATLDAPPVRRDEVEAVLVARLMGGRRIRETRRHALWRVLRCWLQGGWSRLRSKFS